MSKRMCLGLLDWVYVVKLTGMESVKDIWDIYSKEKGFKLRLMKGIVSMVVR